MTYPPDATGSPGYGNPGYPNYGQSSPAGPQHSASQPAHWRGRRPIQVGIILLVVGLALAITGGALANAKSLSKVNGFQRIAVSSGGGTVNFSHAGGYVAYYESRSVSSSTRQVPLIPGVLTNTASGATVQLVTKYGNRSDGKIKALHYDYKGHHGLAMWQFHIDQPGAYRVQFATNNAPDSDAAVAFGPSIAAGVVIGGILVVVGILLLLGGLVTLIVGLVKRRRHKNEVRAGGFGTAAPVGGGSWPRPGGATEWPQPGGATSWPQPGGATTWPAPEGGGTQWPQPDSGTTWPPPQGGGTQWPQGGGTQWPQPGGGTTWPPPEREPNG